MNDQDFKRYVEKETGMSSEEIEKAAKSRWSYQAAQRIAEVHGVNFDSESDEDSGSSSD